MTVTTAEATTTASAKQGPTRADRHASRVREAPTRPRAPHLAPRAPLASIQLTRRPPARRAPLGTTQGAGIRTASLALLASIIPTRASMLARTARRGSIAASPQRRQLRTALRATQGSTKARRAPPSALPAPRVNRRARAPRPVSLRLMTAGVRLTTAVVALTMVVVARQATTKVERPACRAMVGPTPTLEQPHVRAARQVFILRQRRHHARRAPLGTTQGAGIRTASLALLASIIPTRASMLARTARRGSIAASPQRRLLQTGK